MTPNSAQLSRERFELAPGNRVGDRPVDLGRRDVVVGGRDGEVGPADATAREPQAVEGLGRGDLVDEVEVDVEQVRLGPLLPACTTWSSQIFSASVWRCASVTSVDRDDLDLEPAVRRLVLDVVAGAMSEEGLSEGRSDRDHGDVVPALLDGADEEALDVLVLSVADADDRAGADAVGRRRRSRR